MFYDLLSCLSHSTHTRLYTHIDEKLLVEDVYLTSQKKKLKPSSLKAVATKKNLIDVYELSEDPNEENIFANLIEVGTGNDDIPDVMQLKFSNKS